MVITTAVSAVVLTACSNISPASPTVDVPTTAAAAPASETPAADANESARGNLIKQVGETAGWGVSNADISVKFVVDKITIDPKCTTQFAASAQNGHLVKVDMRVETTPSMPPNFAYSINPGAWSAVGEDGITQTSLATAPSFSCLNSNEQLPSQLSPASKYRGSIVLDISSPAGTLIFSHPNPTLGGWEWTYGTA
ncbi:hypothetical protein ACQP04_12985 [Pseudonocardia halophobica]|uniref:hypothetical protein n=1 Tax=Pseudonocardia halophobica TaxID=29401 RepID=UPI003D8C4555